MTDIVEKKIFNTFAEVASAIGYSPIHGHIIGALLVNNGSISLQELAKETGYSLSMISLSLDLLELLGSIKKIKKSQDRKLYVELRGDLLECLKNALLIKVKKGIDNSLSDFDATKKKIKDDKTMKKINILEKELKRLEEYVNLLSEIGMP